jgi:hypothetical protein
VRHGSIRKCQTPHGRTLEQRDHERAQDIRFPFADGLLRQVHDQNTPVVEEKIEIKRTGGLPQDVPDAGIGQKLIQLVLYRWRGLPLKVFAEEGQLLLKKVSGHGVCRVVCHPPPIDRIDEHFRHTQNRCVGHLRQRGETRMENCFKPWPPEVDKEVPKGGHYHGDLDRALRSIRHRVHEIDR